MIEKRSFRLGSELHRQFIGSVVATSPAGCIVTIRPPNRTLEQNALLHAALTDIAEQVEWKGQRFSVIVWKRLCTASWLRERGESPELIPALDGNGFDVIYEHTSEMTVAQLSEFLEWCFAFGAENGVTFKEKAQTS